MGKLLVLFALFALMLSVVSGHCNTCGITDDDHDDAHGDMRDEMTCPSGEVAVMGYGTEMICVVCMDQIDGACGNCKMYAEKGHCADDRFKKFLAMKCPVSCGLC